MAKEADRLAREIEATRKDLVRDVDRLTEHASPTRLVGRRLERMRDGMRSLKDRVIGVSEDAASTVAGTASDVGGAVHEAPKKLAKVAQGSPVGVGLIAFGGGMLAAALIPESPAERRAVRQLSENLGPVLEPLQEAGRALAERRSIHCGDSRRRSPFGGRRRGRRDPRGGRGRGRRRADGHRDRRERRPNRGA